MFQLPSTFNLRTLKPLHFIFIGAILSLVGGVLPSFNIFLFYMPLKINIISIIGATITAIAAFAQHKISSKKNSEILANTGEHLKQIEVVKGNLTGGDSYARLSFFYGGDNSLFLMLMHYGEYPLLDLKIRITDYQCRNSIIKHTNLTKLHSVGQAMTLFNDCDHSFHIGTLLPNTGSIINTDKINLYGTIRTFDIQISSRNGMFLQYQRIYKSDSGWHQAVKIINNHTSEVIFEEIAEHFPSEHLNW